MKCAANKGNIEKLKRCTANGGDDDDMLTTCCALRPQVSERASAVCHYDAISQQVAYW
jgi:hypothetical protein